jgi:hypothetical protein
VPAALLNFIMVVLLGLSLTFGAVLKTIENPRYRQMLAAFDRGEFDVRSA